MASRGQTLTVTYIAWDTGANSGKTGDLSNHTLRIVKDGTSSAPTNSPAEVDSTNAPGVYKLVLTATECTADCVVVCGKSSTAGVSIIPITITFEQLPTAAPAANGGVPTVDSANGVKVSVGTGTGQISLSSGQVTVGTLATAAIASIWNALTSGMTTAGSIGKKLADWVLGTDHKAVLSSDETGSGLSTLATASSQTSILNAVNAITTNTARTSIVVPQFVPLPASGSTTVRVKITLYNLEGVVEDADTNTVTIHASLSDGTSEDANLSSTTATRDSAGQYHVDYTLLSSAAEGGLYIAVTYAVGAVSMAANAVFAVAQADTVTSIAAIKAKTDNLPASPAAVGSAMTLTSAYDSAKSAASQSSVSTIATILSGITSLAQWLGLLAGKQVGDTTARTELRATGAGSGTYDEINDSLQAIRDRGDTAWTTSSGGNGSGANTVTLTINDGTNPLQGAKVRLTNGAQSYFGTTDINGQIVFNLDSLTWTVAISNPGYTFAGASLVVGGDVTHTYSMTALNITASNPGYTTGYATCYDGTGVVESGVVVTATIVQVDSSDTSHIYDTAALSATSDINGLVQFPNLVLGATYRITRGSGVRLITIPLSASSTYALPSFVGTP